MLSSRNTELLSNIARWRHGEEMMKPKPCTGGWQWIECGVVASLRREKYFLPNLDLDEQIPLLFPSPYARK